MKFNPTEDQKKAIYTKRNMLVSAAAGSGKTAILVERVLNAFCDEKAPLMADRVLIVTFTNAAANELKQRIEKGLNERLADDPNNTLLQRQKILLPNAKICTIDSFCINFIRDNFDKADIEPSFKVADNSDIRMLLSLSVTKLINDEFNSENSEFLSLLDYVGSNYDDSNLISIISNIYSFSKNMPYPEYWLKNIVKQYEDFSEGRSNEWFTEVLKIFSEYTDEAENLILKAESALSDNPNAYTAYGESIFYIKDFIDELKNKCVACDWDEIYNLITKFSPPRMKSLSASNKTESSEYAKEQKNSVTDLLKKGFKLIYADTEFIRNEVKESVSQIKKMSELVIKLDEIFSSEMLKRGLITFDMAEQKALRLLSEFKDGKIVKSSSADDYISQFDEVLVDEYQDTNNLQDTLFNIISDNQHNLFCVGDAKQSIYRFRGANPLNFINKKKLYSSIESEDSFGLRVDLSGNFRSRKGICDYANRLFKFIMTEDNAQIEYDEKERLESLAKFPESSHAEVENHFIDYDSALENEELHDVPKSDLKATIEAHTLARLIKSYTEQDAFITDKKTKELRRAEYGDIVILMRSTKLSSVFSSVFKQYDIPVLIPSADLLQSDEVITLLSLLKIIDNPFDDVAMLTVLTSKLFGFTLDEISEFRANSKKGKIVSSLAASLERSNKLNDFWNFLGECRQKSVIYKVSYLIDYIFDTTNYPIIVSRLNDGASKKTGLYAIRDFSVSFERDGKKSLKEFLKSADTMIDKDFQINAPTNSNAVRIMTVHSSKGLQFPICILADCDHMFNFSDCRNQLLLNEKHGFSFSYYDEDMDNKAKPLLRILMSEYEKKQVLSEEVRLLYVALTRAEDKLVTTACVKNFKKKIENFMDMDFFENGSLKGYIFCRSQSYLDWIFADSFLNSADKFVSYLKSGITDEFIHDSITFSNTETKNKPVADDALAGKLISNYELEYPYQQILSIESKASVTDIVHKTDSVKYQFTSRPSFMNSGGLSAAEKGTATHKFMQFCDFDKAIISVLDEIERLYEYGYLTESESKAVNIDSVTKFFVSELFRKIQDADKVSREKNFLCEFPANKLKSDLDPSYSDEKIIVQGSVDLLFIKDKKITIVDFKTDRNKNREELIGAYSKQLRIYKEAVEQIYKLPVNETLLYSFELGEEIEC